MPPRFKREIASDLVVSGRLTVYGGVNSPDVVKNITDTATTSEKVSQIEASVSTIEATLADVQVPQLYLSTASAKRNRAGTISPGILSVSAAYKSGTAYAGRFVISISHDGETYVEAYRSSANESSYTYTIPASMTVEGVSYYVASIRVDLEEAR